MNPIAKWPHLLLSPKPWTAPRQRGSCEKEYVNWVFAVVAAICLGLASIAQAATIYVDAAMPNDNGNGLTPQTAKKYIPSGITASADGDIIEVNAGTYALGAVQLNINKSVSIKAKAGLSSKPKITTSYTSYSFCAVRIAANNVVFDGFEIDGSSAFTTFPSSTSCYLIGDYNSGSNVGYDGWAVRNCYLHNGREGLRLSSDNNVTIEANEIAQTVKHCIDCGNGICYGLKVRTNWLHSEQYAFGAKPAGIYYFCDHPAGNNVEFSYNYCTACRTFCDFAKTANGDAPSNDILIMHNTVDWKLAPLTSPVLATDNGQMMGIAFWAEDGSSGNPTQNWNSSHFIIRDNIFSRTKWYAVVATPDNWDPLLGLLQLQNNLFSQWFLCDAYNVPANTCYNQWPGSRGAVGWGNFGSGNGFGFNSDLQADPLYAATGTTADAYYALTTGSPALGTASDGTDIGAWQTLPVHDLTKDTYFSAIQLAIDAANPSDVIEVSAGTYNEYLSINKSLTLRGSAAGTQPTVQFTDIATSGVTVTANNVTIENLRFYRPGNSADAALLGVPKGGVWPNYTIDYSNLTLTNCTFEWGRYALYVHIQGLNVEGCQFLNNYRNGIILGGTKGTINILHNYIDGTVRSARNLVYITTGSGTPDIEGTININYNTSFNKVQFFLMDFWGVDFSKKINLNIQHNTIDYATSKPIIFYWPPANGFTKFSSIAIRDNIFSNGKLGVIVDFNTTDNSVVPSNGQIVVDNNLFFNNADDASYTKCPANPNIGWSANGPTPSGASGNMFSLTGNLAGNPLYSAIAPKPNPYYTLANGFPALGTASDGTDIGAWQTPTIKIGGTVFSDNNGNGLPDAGEGIPNITVTLHGDINGDGTQETVTTSTDADGNYLFTGLRTTAVGVNYTVTVDTSDPDFPMGLKINSVDPDGGGDSTAALSLTDANPSNLNQDFGYAPTYSIGNRVFNDNGANGGTVNNGHQDGTEPGISGVAMKLYAADGAGNPTGNFLAATNTDSSGYYRFDG